MLNKFTICLLLITLTAFYACHDNVVDTLNPSQPPTTKLFLDSTSVISQQPSKITMHWTGDAPAGQIVGYYFSWGDNKWSFTTRNDSTFSLPIGAVDKVFTFKVSAVDNSGNGTYDSNIKQNGIDYGPEPFVADTVHKDGVWHQGELFTDIGLIDPHPASVNMPIKNTAPTISWNDLSFHPDISLPVMSFGWIASDIDGDSTITTINIALDTLNANNVVSLDGSVKVITIRDAGNATIDILINGSSSNVVRNLTTGDTIKLPGMKYDNYNEFFVQAVDLSGAKSSWISTKSQKNSKPDWFVTSKKGNLLIVDNYESEDGASAYYNALMDSVVSPVTHTPMTGKFNVLDLLNQKLPYANATFLETIKLFPCILWYSDNNPSLDLANSTIPRYLSIPGKRVFFSMQFPQIPVMSQLEGFLPITDSTNFINSMTPGRTISDSSHSGYPTLRTIHSLARARAFYPSSFGVTPIYSMSDNASFPRSTLNGWIGFETVSSDGKNTHNMFFVSMPLHWMCMIPNSVPALLTKVLFNDFNLTQ